MSALIAKKKDLQQAAKSVTGKGHRDFYISMAGKEEDAVCVSSGKQSVSCAVKIPAILPEGGIQGMRFNGADLKKALSLTNGDNVAIGRECLRDVFPIVGNQSSVAGVWLAYVAGDTGDKTYLESQERDAGWIVGEQEGYPDAVFTMPALKALVAMLPFTSEDEYRSHLNGVYVDTATGALAATDGHKMSIHEGGAYMIPHMWQGAIIPSVFIKALERMFGDMPDHTTLYIKHTAQGSEMMRVYSLCGRVVYGTCSLGGVFPDYRRVTPKEDELRGGNIYLTKKDVKAIQKAVPAFEKEYKDKRNRFEAFVAFKDGNVSITGYNGEEAEMPVSLSEESRVSGDPVKFTFPVFKAMVSMQGEGAVDLSIPHGDGHSVRDAVLALYEESDKLFSAVMPVRF